MVHLVEQLQETGFHFHTQHRLLALIHSPEVAEAAIGELLDQGLSLDAIHTWSGPEGAALLDPDGAEHGPVARAWRSAQWLSGERQLIERYARAIRKGRVGLSIRCQSIHEAVWAKRVLDWYSARSVTYFGSGSIETF